MNNNEAITLLQDAADRGDAMLEMAQLAPTDARAIARLLKEQEPKAIEYHDNPFTGLPVAHCPNCKRYAQQFHSSVEEETHYCSFCGKAVKWDD